MTAPHPEFKYDAFISYRRTDGSVHAQGLCRKLLDYKLPPELKDDVSRQELSIYLDTRYERADSDFFEDTIKPALRESRHLIVVQTPDALKPRDDGTPNWVEREIEYFCGLPQEGRKVSIALAKGDFNGPLAGDLRRRFPQIQIVDIRRFGSLRPGKSHHELLKFVGALYEVPRELMPELRQEEAQRRTASLRRYLAAAILLVVVLSGLLGWALYSRYQTQKALSQSDLREASTLIEKDEAGQALAFLARAIRLDPNNLPARTWMTDLLLRRTWSVPVLEIRDEERFVAADLSPDGRLLLTATEAGKIQVRDARTGRPLGSPLNHPGSMQTCFSQDGMRIITRGGGKALIWDTPTGRLISSFGVAAETNFLISMHVSSDASTLALVHTNGIRFVNLRVKQLKSSFHVIDMVDVDPLAFYLSPDGRQFLMVESLRERGWRIVRSNLSPNLVPTTLISGFNSISKASFNQDGNLVAIADQYSKVQVWDINSRQPIGEQIHHKSDINSIHFSPDSRKIVTASEDRSARVWDSSTGRALAEPLQHANSVMNARFSPDSRQVITASTDSTVRTWDIQASKAGSELLNLQNSVRLSPDASMVASVVASRAYIQELPSGRAMGRPIGPIAQVPWPHFSSNGRYLISIEQDPTGWKAHVWNIETGRAIRGSPFKAVNLVISPDGRKIAAITGQGFVSVYDLRTGRILADRLPHRGFSEVVIFSPDSDRLTTAPSFLTVRIWDSETAKQIGKDLSHDDNIMSVEFSPDRHDVITASTDGTARIWDVQSGALKGNLLHFGSSLRYAQFGPDGDFFLLGSQSRVSTFDKRTSKTLASPPFPGMSLKYHGISADGSVVLTSTFSSFTTSEKNIHLLYVWHPRTGELLINPLEENNHLQDARLRPDGRILYTVIDGLLGYSVHAWQISAGSSDDAETLARLAETAGGLRLDEDGRLVSLENWLSQINDLRNLPLNGPDDPTSAAALARWFFADRSTRTLSPLSKITVPDFIRGRLARGTDEAREEALEAYPDHPLVLEKLRRAPSSPPQSPN